ncbi:MAG: hypothetical protein ABI285_11205 [Ginsengibacter sp.]
MKKLTVIAFLFPFILCAQTQSIETNKKKIGKVECIKLTTVYATGDTSKNIMFSFRNEEYEVLTDYKSIEIPLDKKEILAFIKDLKETEAPMNAKGSIRWSREKYLLIVYDNTQKISLGTPENSARGYVSITNKQAEKIIDWLTPLIPQ